MARGTEVLDCGHPPVCSRVLPPRSAGDRPNLSSPAQYRYPFLTWKVPYGPDRVATRSQKQVVIAFDDRTQVDVFVYPDG